MNDSEILIFSEAKINKVSSLISACQNKITSLENEMMVKEKKQNIKDMMAANLNSMMQLPPKLKKKVTYHEDVIDKSR